ncbi:hypothetical protein [Brevibacillus borstelensis]|uniref:hypothetical protein n=1 Tax=Brevibacillus borstelensis TaxID=45462 RepID=UPI00287FCC11|nr:hypothetical protein [Brevibacillus borstelensis]WNF07494.1 hypothetical protein RFB14_08855 [Brevibacillus borstelensis]
MKTFLNDRDGVSERDYLLLAATTVFFVFVVIGLILVLLGRPIDAMYIALLDMVAPVLMTITGGVFGVRAVQEFRKKKSDTAEEEAEDYDARV